MGSITSIKAQKTWTESNYDNFSKIKNRDEKAYDRFKRPCFFQSEGYVHMTEEVEDGENELEH